MQNFIISVALLCTSIGVTQYDNKEADSLLQQLIIENKVIGASAGYAIDGEIIWQSTIGYANKEMGEKFEIDTKTRLASIAKSMTAVAIMQLVEQDLIDLDAPIQTYIPEYPKQVKTQITTRHLLSHTSGIDGYKNSKEAQTTTNYPNMTDAVNVFKDRTLKFEPGTKYRYTTYGYVVLGLLIEKITDLTFEAYMKKNIWDRAEMTHTGIEKFGGSIKNKSNLYHRDKKGKIKEGKENNLSNRVPGGGFYSSLEDMLKFGNAILKNTLVTESTLNIMRQHHSLEKEANAYGFGWFLYNSKPNEGAIIGHNGQQTGSSCQLFIIPNTKTVVVVLSNTSAAYEDVGPLAGTLLSISQKK